MHCLLAVCSQRMWGGRVSRFRAEADVVDEGGERGDDQSLPEEPD